VGLTTRSFDVLSAFTADRTRMTLAETSRRAGLPLTTTHRIVRDLLDWGALERSDDGQLQIGLRLWQVASLAPRGLGLREVALPFMEDLFVATQDVVQLAVREGTQVVYVERLTGRTSVKVLTRVGDRFALHATGVGLVLLAHAPADVQEAVLEAPLRAWTPHTVTDPRRLRRLLAEVRRDGYAVSDRQVTEDAVSVAVPVRTADGHVAAALSLVLRHGSARADLLVPALRTAAGGITRALGAPPRTPGQGDRNA
jgi:DNA-binding IclR family transcriptional regulator